MNTQETIKQLKELYNKISIIMNSTENEILKKECKLKMKSLKTNIEMLYITSSFKIIPSKNIN